MQLHDRRGRCGLIVSGDTHAQAAAHASRGQFPAHPCLPTLRTITGMFAQTVARGWLAFLYSSEYHLPRRVFFSTYL